MAQLLICQAKFWYLHGTLQAALSFHSNWHWSQALFISTEMCIEPCLWRTTTTLSGLFHERKHIPIFFPFTCKLAALKKTKKDRLYEWRASNFELLAPFTSFLVVSVHNIKDNTPLNYKTITSSEYKATHFLGQELHLQIITPRGHKRQ